MPPDRSPDGIGRKLRTARERRGISLRQVSTATKISIAALEAIEQDDPARLPGGIFSRAFVRSYAAEVGLDPDQAVQEFLAQFPQEPPPGVPPAPAGDGRDLSGDRRTRPHAQMEDGEALESERQMASTFLRLIFFSIPIAIVVVYLGTRPPREPVDPPVAEIPAAAAPAAPPAPAPTDSAPAASALPAPATAAVPETRPAALETPAPAPPAPDTAAAFTVALSATGPCWVSAAVNGKRVVERLMQPGEQQTIAVHGDLVLTAGDPSALAVRINGVEARPLGRAGQVATARLNASNFQSFLARP